jgi:hypothetical protein
LTQAPFSKGIKENKIFSINPLKTQSNSVLMKMMTIKSLLECKQLTLVANLDSCSKRCKTLATTMGLSTTLSTRPPSLKEPWVTRASPNWKLSKRISSI